MLINVARVMRLRWTACTSFQRYRVILSLSLISLNLSNLRPLIFSRNSSAVISAVDKTDITKLFVIVVAISSLFPWTSMTPSSGILAKQSMTIHNERLSTTVKYRASYVNSVNFSAIQTALANRSEEFPFLNASRLSPARISVCVRNLVSTSLTKRDAACTTCAFPD